MQGFPAIIKKGLDIRPHAVYNDFTSSGNVPGNVSDTFRTAELSCGRFCTASGDGMVNIKDIAKYCGISVSTASRALNGHQDVSDATRRRVEDAVRKYNYIPNNSARNLVRTRSETVAVVVRGASNQFFVKMIKVVEQEIYRRGYSMELHQIDSDDDEVKAAAMLVNEKRLIGVLFLGGRFNYTKDELALLSVPFVCCTYTNTFGSLDEDSYSSVAVDDKKAAYKAVMHLIQNGHRRIAALVAHQHDRSISELRFDGYRQALSDAGVAFDEALTERAGSFQMRDAYDATGRLWERSGGFTALFAIADVMAIAGMKALHDRGLAVPDDVSVISIDGLELSAYAIPTLTTLTQPADAMAHESASLLLDLVEGKSGNRHMVMETALRAGGSLRSLI